MSLDATSPPRRGNRAVRPVLGIAEVADSIGIEPRRRPGAGTLNIWGNTFPADELPCGRRVEVNGIEFRFPDADGVHPDHVRCRGQRISLPAQEADWIHVLAVAERRTEDCVSLLYRDGSTRRQWLRVSDFWPQTSPRFGDRLAFRTSVMLYPRHVQDTMRPAIWHQRIPVAVPDGLVALELPVNQAIHVFALTLVTEGRRAA